MLTLLKSPEFLVAALTAILLGGLGVIGWLLKLAMWVTKIEARMSRQDERDTVHSDMLDKIYDKVVAVEKYQVRQNGAVALKIEQESNEIRKDFRSEMQAVSGRIDRMTGKA